MKKSPQTAAGRRKARKAEPNHAGGESGTTVAELAQFYHTADAALFGMAVEAGRHLRFIFANPCFLAAAGLLPDQVLGKRIEQIIDEPACTRVMEHCREAIRSRQTVRWNETYAHPEGIKYGKISVVPVLDDEGQGRGEQQVGCHVDMSHQPAVGMEVRGVAAFEARGQGDLVAGVEVGRGGRANPRHRPRLSTTGA